MKIVIVNGTHEADFIVRKLKKEKHQLIVINSNKTFGSYISGSNKVPVLCGDPTKDYILDDAHVENADVMIALSENDIDNYVACITGKKLFHIGRTVCVVRNPKRVELFKDLGIDSVISSTYLLGESITNESIIESFIKTITLENNQIMISEITIEQDFDIVGKALKDANLPQHIIISCIYRAPEVIIPNGDSIIKANDKIIIVTTPSDFDFVIESIRKKVPTHAFTRG